MSTRSANAEKSASTSPRKRPVTFHVNEDAPDTVYLLLEENYTGHRTQFQMPRAEWNKLTGTARPL